MASVTGHAEFVSALLQVGVTCHVSRVSCRHVSPLQDDVHVLPRDAAPGPGRGGRAADPGGGAGGGQVQTPGVCVATGIIYLLFAVTS